MNSSNSNIDYGEIIKKSFQTAIKNRWLWVYGLVLTIFGGSQFNFRGNTSFSNFPEIKKDVSPEKPQQTIKVLGETTNMVKDWFQNIPPGVYISLGLAVFLLIILGLLIALILRNWAKGSLIAGLEKAHDNKPVNLSGSSSTGRKKIKPLILATVITTLISLGVFFVIGTIWSLPLLVLKQSVLKTVIMIFLGIVTILALIIMAVLFSLLGLYTDRLIILHNYSPWEAWKKGMQLSWKHFLPSILMRILNTVIGCTVGCLTSLILLLFSGGSIFAVVLPIIKGKKQFSFSALIVILFSLLIFFALNLLIKALLVVFNYSNWNIMFKKVLAREAE